MVWQILAYLLIAFVTALIIAAYDGGQRWGAIKCSLLGLGWPLTFFIMMFILIKQKIKGRQ